MTRTGSLSVTRCSLVVRVIDAWTGRPVSGSGVRASLDGIGSKPIRTSDGSFAFLNVDQKTCELIISSATYLEERLPLDLSLLPASAPVVVVSLQPSRLYPPPPASAGVEVAVRDLFGRPLTGVAVAALVDAEDAVRGRLADEQAAGSITLRYVPGAVRLQEGDVVALREREGGAAEWCRIRTVDAAECRLKLAAPLERSWKRGARLLPAALARGDGGGTIVVPFRGSLPSACEAEARLSLNGRFIDARWPMRGGEVARPDDIVWPGDE